MYKKAVRILKVKWGLEANKKSLLPALPLKIEQSSLLTDFHRVDEIPYRDNLDGRVLVIDGPGVKVSLRIEPETVALTGGIAKLIKQGRDPRYTLFGNEGLLFRHTCKLLEDKYDIHSFHACVMYQPAKRKVFIICGSAGSGKSCFILRGLELGLKLFSAEMTHFKIAGGRIRLYKGALVDNVRVGNLKYNFPSVLRKTGISLPRTGDIWGKKIPLDLNAFQTPVNSLVDPGIVIILPRIEQERRDHILREGKDRRKVCRNLFENASEKIGQSFLLYENIPAVCLDTPTAAARRIRAIKRLLNHRRLEKIVSVVAGPENCWRGLIE